MIDAAARAKRATSGLNVPFLPTGGTFALRGQLMPAVGAVALAALGLDVIIWAFLARATGPFPAPTAARS